MDDSRFDALVRSLRRHTDSRRRVLASGVASVLLGGIALPDADAKKKKGKKKCKKGTVRCGKKCCPATCVSQSVCGANCKCFFDVANALACYDLGTQGVCCNSAAECAPGQGCVSGACSAGGKAGGCFSLCAS